MGIADSTLWWLLAGACVALELVTGTFYLLMLATGFVAAAAITYAGVDTTGQIITAAGVGGGAVVLCYVLRSRGRRGMAPEANPNMSLDIGEMLSIDAWNPDATASVHYRGARWTVVQRGTAPPQPGLHRVVAVVGNRLMVDKA